MRKPAFPFWLVVFSLFLSGCNLFGPPKDSEIHIPPGASDVLGIVRYIDDFPGESMDVTLAGQTVRTDEGGAFFFSDVDNGIYTLNVLKKDTAIGEQRIVVKGDIGDFVVLIGENDYERSSFEEQPLGALSPSTNLTDVWTANLALSGPASDIKVVNTEARTGSNSVQVDGITIDSISSLSTVRQYGRNLVGGATYRITAWFKTDPAVTTVGPEPGSDDPVYMRLRFYSAVGGGNIAIRGKLDTLMVAPESPYYEDAGVNFVKVYPLSHDDEWNRLYAEFKLPEDADRLLLELSSRANWNGGDETSIWWDDVTLIRID